MRAPLPPLRPVCRSRALFGTIARRMSSSGCRAFALCIVLLFAREDAMAGQLMIDDFGLKDVAEREGYVYLGTMASPFKKGEIELTIKKVYVANERSLTQGREGQTDTIDMYKPVVWQDPRKSP